MRFHLFVFLSLTVLAGCSQTPDPPRRVVEQKPLTCALSDGPCEGFGESNPCARSRDCPADRPDCYGPADFDCGHPNDGQCTVGADHCESGEVCEPLTGGCVEYGAGNCVPDCRTSNNCGEGERCVKKTGLCEAIPCNELGSSQCGPMLQCSDGLGAEFAGCDRVECLKDADCPDGGSCWNYFCYTSPSRCDAPAP